MLPVQIARGLPAGGMVLTGYGTERVRARRHESSLRWGQTPEGVRARGRAGRRGSRDAGSSRGSAALDEHRRGPRQQVVVRRHARRVGAGRGHRQQVAGVQLREPGALDQHIAGLAVLAGDRVDAVGIGVGAVAGDRLVDRAVERRARVVGHPAVHRGVRHPAGRLLDRTHPVQRDAGRADDRAARLHDQLGHLQPVGDQPLREVGADLLERRLDRQLHLALHVRDREAAADVQHRQVAQAVLLDERDQPVDHLQVRPRVADLRAQMHVHAARLDVQQTGRRVQRVQHVDRREAELGRGSGR